MNRVFDASALVTFLLTEAEYEAVGAILSDPNNSCFCHLVNAVEVYSVVARASDEKTAESAIQDLVDLGVHIVADFDETLTKQASNWTCLFQMSLADGFGLALAQRVSADFVSCDHHELDIISQSGLVPVTFVRPPKPTKNQEAREIAKAKGALIRLKQLEDAGSIGGAWREALKPLLNV